MARSAHTRPRRILAAERVRAPRAPRVAADPRSPRRRAAARGDGGTAGEPPAPLPRVILQRPSAGYLHPASRGDVVQLLRLLGDACSYGLRAVVLARGPAAEWGGGLLLGRLLVPGQIVLFPQPPPPWRLAGRLSATTRARLERAGARVELAGGGAQTLVAWPDDALRALMLFDVLAHEIGHHLLQQYAGKRQVRAARTREHEAFAARFAERSRLQYWPRLREQV